MIGFQQLIILLCDDEADDELVDDEGGLYAIENSNYLLQHIALLSDDADVVGVSARQHLVLDAVLALDE